MGVPVIFIEHKHRMRWIAPAMTLDQYTPQFVPKKVRLLKNRKSNAFIPGGKVFPVKQGQLLKIWQERNLNKFYLHSSSTPFLFEPNDEKLKEIESQCKQGHLLCGEHKQSFAEKIEKFLIDHNRKREELKDTLEDYFLKSDTVLKKILK